MPNIKLSYFYRDAGNYKNHGEVIFPNPEGKSIEQVESLIKQKLIDGQWFYAHKWQLPDLHFQTWNAELDNGFHEFKSMSYTEGPANSSKISLAGFLNLVLNTDWK